MGPSPLHKRKSVYQILYIFINIVQGEGLVDSRQLTVNSMETENRVPPHPTRFFALRRSRMTDEGTGERWIPAPAMSRASSKRE